MTLTEFLLARISEDEEKASAAEALASIYAPKKVRWHWLRTDGNSSAWEPTNHTPARVLAECKAKRAVIDAAWADHLQIEGEWGHGKGMAQLESENDQPDVVRFLAAVYSDHPDYRAEWAQ